jgi:HAD superfamily hydrolase (TIGR01484 family)
LELTHEAVVQVSAVASGAAGNSSRFASLPSLGPAAIGRALQRSSEAGDSSDVPVPARRIPIIVRVIAPTVLEWARCEPRLLRGVCGVLTDIDDTLSTDGAIPLGVVAALAALRETGIPVIAVTGRPMGWSRPIAETLPLAAVVAENGAVGLFRDAAGLQVEYADPEPVRRANAVRLRAVAERIVAEVPGATLSRDSVGRATDISVDHSEHVHLDPARVAEVAALMRSEGMTATVSSIHVNGWYGSNSKLSGAAWIVRRLLGRDLDAERERWIFVGDSTNDEAMFAAFPLSVGVANLADFADRLRQWPAYITEHERGRGFVEVAEALLAARAA